MNVTVLESVPHDPEIGAAWNDLVARAERPEVFFTHQWALASARAFADTYRPLTFLGYEAGTLVGVAAMAQVREHADTACFMTASTADYCDILSDPSHREAMAGAVLTELRKREITNVVWGNVPSESCTPRVIPSVAALGGFHLHDRPAYNCGVIELRDHSQRQEVLRTITRKERERRALKKLARIGEIQLRHLEGKQLAPALDSILSAQVVRFLITDRLSPLISHPRRVFLQQLAAQLDAAGWLRISQLEVAGKPIAWNYGFRFADTWFWYLPTFLVEYEEYSPGSCLLRLLTEEACADTSVRRLDLGLGDEPYKERFANSLSKTRHISLSVDLSRHLRTCGRDKVSKFIRRFPAVEQRARGVRMTAAKVQLRIAKSGLRDTAGHVVDRIRRRVLAETEVHIFEGPRLPKLEQQGESLVPLTWEQIADMALRNWQDEETLQYLMRCARRLKAGNAVGYCLDRQSVPVHVLWVAPCKGFHLDEINWTFDSTNSEGDMIFDCWTPKAERGKGYYAEAIRLVSAMIGERDRTAWIFSGAANRSSLAGIVKAGFEYRYSMVRRTIMGRSEVARRVSSFQKNEHAGLIA